MWTPVAHHPSSHTKNFQETISAAHLSSQKGGSPFVQALALICAVSVDQRSLVLHSRGDAPSLTCKRATAHGMGEHTVHVASSSAGNADVLLSLQSKTLCPQAARKSGGAACSRHCLALPRELQEQNVLELPWSSCHLSQDKAVREKDATERLCQQSSFFAVSKHNDLQC